MKWNEPKLIFNFNHNSTPLFQSEVRWWIFKAVCWIMYEFSRKMSELLVSPVLSTHTAPTGHKTILYHRLTMIFLFHYIFLSGFFYIKENSVNLIEQNIDSNCNIIISHRHINSPSVPLLKGIISIKIFQPAVAKHKL